MPVLVIGPPVKVMPLTVPLVATEVTVPVPVSVGLARATAAPAPAPSVYSQVFSPVAIVTSAPEPCLIVMLCPPVVAFSTIHTLETVLGAKVAVLVPVRETAEVNLRYNARTPSAVASGIVNVSLVSAANCLVPYPSASVISSKLALVEVPQVPSSSPVVISFSLKLFT